MNTAPLGQSKLLRFMQRPPRTILGATLGLVAAVIPVLGLWGFTVDDALISARVATHLRAGLGYRFNPDGPIVDAVTPLGWAHLLAAIAAPEPFATLKRAQVLGTVIWLVASACLGLTLARLGRRRWRFLPLVVVAISSPLAAWAVSGMETPLLAVLAAFAVLHRRAAPALGSLAAGMRPELLPWALVLGACARQRGVWAWGTALRGALLVAAGPFCAALARSWAFGSALPLSVWAKPSDLSHGLRYAAGALCFTGFPCLCLAPRVIRKLGYWPKVVLVAGAAHLTALVLIGGDWMALFRLAVPILPGLAWVGGIVAERSSLLWNSLRGAFAVACAAPLLVVLGPSARTVGPSREQLIRAANAPLQGSQRVATLDVGWVSAVSERAVFDLAGVTDPAVAHLPRRAHLQTHCPGLVGLAARGHAGAVVATRCSGRAPLVHIAFRARC